MTKTMKQYVVMYTDSNGATSEIDCIKAAEGYTAEQYVSDCDRNADMEWCDMLHNGSVELVEVEE